MYICVKRLINMAQNNLLSEQFNYIGASKTPTHLHLCCYDAEKAGFYSARSMDELVPYLNKQCINWVQIHGLQNTGLVEQVCRYFGIDFLTTQDILNSNHLTKIEEHENYNVVILKQLVADGANSYFPQQFCIIQGSYFVLTFLERESDFLDEIHTALTNNVLKIRNRQSDFLLSVILNSVMVSFISILSKQEDELEDLEEALLSQGKLVDSNLEALQPYRRNVRLIKKSIIPLKEQFNKLFHLDNTLLHEENRPFFRDVNDHLQFVLQTLDGCRDMIVALVDLYLSNNDQRMNNIMKQLTVVSTIFIPLTFLAGIWGMNFQWMPELTWKHGYLFAWVLMLVLGLSAYIYFKRKKWY